MEKSRVFLDSNYLIALFYPGDALHKKAREHAGRLATGHYEPVTSSLIFLETVTVTSQRGGKEAGLAAGEQLLDGAICMIHMGEGLQSDAWHVFRAIPNKDVSFVDASIIATMKAEGVRTLLTFDAHFRPLAKKYSLKLFS